MMPLYIMLYSTILCHAHYTHDYYTVYVVQPTSYKATRARVHTLTHTHTYTYVNIHTRTHTYIYIHIHHIISFCIVP